MIKVLRYTKNSPFSSSHNRTEVKYIIEEVNLRAKIMDLVYMATHDTTVFLVKFDNECFVTENCELICELFDRKLNSAYPYYENDDIHIFEFVSYLDACMHLMELKNEIKRN